MTFTASYIIFWLLVFHKMITQENKIVMNSAHTKNISNSPVILRKVMLYLITCIYDIALSSNTVSKVSCSDLLEGIVSIHCFLVSCGVSTDEEKRGDTNESCTIKCM